MHMRNVHVVLYELLFSRQSRPPLKSIPVSGLFEVVGMDFKEMDLS